MPKSEQSRQNTLSFLIMKHLKMLILLLGLFVTYQSFAQSSVNPYESYGQRHNQGCLYVLQNLNYLPPFGNRKPVVEQILSNILTPSEFEGYSMPELATYEEKRAVAFAYCSLALQAQVISVENFLKTTPNVPAIFAFIGSKENSAQVDVPPAELNKYFAFLAVTKYSAQLWWPSEKGGQNATQYFAAPHSGSNGGGGTIWAFTWWKIGAIDAFGALGGAFGGPPGAIAGAAAGSVCELISQW